MAVSETDQSQFSLEAEDLQSDQEKRTSVVMYIAGDPVWTDLSRLSATDYINYTEVIKKERLRAISSFTNVYAGALHAKLPDGDRCVYFEPQPNPARPVMRVAKDDEWNDTVKTSYPWERVNFVYKVVKVEGEGKERTFMCYIYTPANLDSYGLVVKKKKVYLESTSSQGFTSVQITQKDPSRDKKTFGLYIDAGHGWKVKATTDRQSWATFSIKPFSYQNPVPHFSPQLPSGNVNWDRVGSLKLHHQFIKERMPALFQESSGDNVFVGALHVESPSGKDMDSAQISHFESADRINFVYYQVAAESSEYTFQIYTPAKLGTYGLKATEEELIFEVLPEGDKHEEYFTYFQIKRGESANPITTTTRHTTLGVYVDTSDGWKMKLTEKEEHWDKFRIAGFTPKTITAAVEARSDS